MATNTPVATVTVKSSESTLSVGTHTEAHLDDLVHLLKNIRAQAGCDLLANTIRDDGCATLVSLLPDFSVPTNGIAPGDH